MILRLFQIERDPFERLLPSNKDLSKPAAENKSSFDFISNSCFRGIKES